MLALCREILFCLDSDSALEVQVQPFQALGICTGNRQRENQEKVISLINPFSDAGLRDNCKSVNCTLQRPQESMCETAQLYISSQKGLCLKVWAKFCSFSAASCAHLPSAPSPSLSVSAACSSLPSGSAGALSHSPSHTKLRTIFNPLTSPSSF